MAKRTAKGIEKPKYRCRDCRHSYDWHEKNRAGEFFMCRCPYHHNGKYIKFLSAPQCEHFARRENV